MTSHSHSGPIRIVEHLHKMSKRDDDGDGDHAVHAANANVPRSHRHTHILIRHDKKYYAFCGSVCEQQFTSIFTRFPVCERKKTHSNVGNMMEKSIQIMMLECTYRAQNYFFVRGWKTKNRKSAKI